MRIAVLLLVGFVATFLCPISMDGGAFFAPAEQAIAQHHEHQTQSHTESRTAGCEQCIDHHVNDALPYASAQLRIRVAQHMPAVFVLRQMNAAFREYHPKEESFHPPIPLVGSVILRT